VFVAATTGFQLDRSLPMIRISITAAFEAVAATLSLDRIG
jgi:hypothetical protein